MVQHQHEPSAKGVATKNSSSLRPTIPEQIVEELQLAPGDVLDWEELPEKGKKSVNVRKLE